MVTRQVERKMFASQVVFNGMKYKDHQKASASRLAYQKELEEKRNATLDSNYLSIAVNKFEYE